MQTTMKLKPEPFNAIKSGVKDIELRLNDEKRQRLRAGDTIIFAKLPEMEETLVAEVVSLLYYPTFAALVEDFPPQRMGGVDKVSIVEGMNKYYSKEEQAELGVVGIKLKLIQSAL